MKSARKIEQLLTQLKTHETSKNQTKQLSSFRKVLKNIQDAKEINLFVDRIPLKTIKDYLKNILGPKEKEQKIIAASLWLFENYLPKLDQIEDSFLDFILPLLQTKDFHINYLASRALFTLCQLKVTLQEEVLKRVKEKKLSINSGNQYYLQQIISPGLSEIFPANREQFIVLSETYARRDDILLGEPLSPDVLSKVKYLYVRNPITLPQLPTKFGTRLIGDTFTPLTQEENALIIQWMDQGGVLLIEIDEIDKPVGEYLQQFGITKLQLSMKAFNPIYVWGTSEMVDPQLRKKEIYYEPPTIVFKTTKGDQLLTLQNGVETKIWGKKMGSGYLVVGALVSALDPAVSYILFRIKSQNRLHAIINQMRSELIAQKKIFIPDFANKNGITPGELKTLIEENISRGQLLAYIQEWFLIAYEK